MQQLARRTLLAVATTAVSIRAWTSHTLTPASSLVSRSFAQRALLPSSSLSRPVSRSTMNMFFSRLFGSTSSTIDYNALDFPGPELAQWARAGQMPATSSQQPELALATFAGGCFWGLELAFQRVPGVAYTAVGYTQGREENPTYNQVCSGRTGHTEATLVYYNPKEVSYEQLLDTFFSRVDPTTVNGQGNDRGKQYRTGVYFHSPEQEKIARERFQREQINYRRPLASELLPARPFWPAEKYHQQYLAKGGRSGYAQNAAKGATEPIRCYG